MPNTATTRVHFGPVAIVGNNGGAGCEWHDADKLHESFQRDLKNFQRDVKVSNLAAKHSRGLEYHLCPKRGELVFLYVNVVVRRSQSLRSATFDFKINVAKRLQRLASRHSAASRHRAQEAAKRDHVEALKVYLEDRMIATDGCFKKVSFAVSSENTTSPDATAVQPKHTAAPSPLLGLSLPDDESKEATTLLARSA